MAKTKVKELEVPYIENLKDRAKPWEQILWPTSQIRSMYRDWGDYFLRCQSITTASHYYTKSMLFGLDPQALYKRSHCRRVSGDGIGAINDSTLAASMKNLPPYDLEVVAGLHDANRLEDAIVHVKQSASKYRGHNIKQFCESYGVLHSHLEDCLGNSLTPFIKRHKNLFPSAMEKVLESRRPPDDRPLWKILKEQEKCDVTSIIEEEIKLLSPLELARRRRSYNVFNQIYFGRTWKDYEFLKNLIENKKLFPQMTIEIKNYICYRYNMLRKYRKILHSRLPIHKHREITCPLLKKNLCKEYREAYLYRVQNETRRTCLNILRTMEQYRKKNDLNKMLKFVEKFMGEYMSVKIIRVMPWKLEFIYKVFNLLGLTIIDHIVKVPDNILEIEQKLRLVTILGMHTEVEQKEFRFGDRSTHSNIFAVDKEHERYSQCVAHFENRLRFAQHPIEASYLYYQLACKHWEHKSYSEASATAIKGKTMAKNCKNSIWSFINSMMYVKVQASLFKFQHTQVGLLSTYRLVKNWDSLKIITFIEFLQLINDYNVEIKRQSLNTLKEHIRKRSKRSTTSLSFSGISIASDDSPASSI